MSACRRKKEQSFDAQVVITPLGSGHSVAKNGTTAKRGVPREGVKGPSRWPVAASAALEALTRHPASWSSRASVDLRGDARQQPGRALTGSSSAGPALPDCSAVGPVQDRNDAYSAYKSPDALSPSPAQHPSCRRQSAPETRADGRLSQPPSLEHIPVMFLTLPSTSARTNAQLHTGPTHGSPTQLVS